MICIRLSVLIEAKIHLKNLFSFIHLTSFNHRGFLPTLRNLMPREEIRFLVIRNTDIVTLSISDKTTKIKSSLFQLSVKYSLTPIPMIFMMASAQNTYTKTSSIMSKVRRVSSENGISCRIKRTKESYTTNDLLMFKKMMINITMSNHLECTILSRNVYLAIRTRILSIVLNFADDFVKFVSDLMSSQPWKNISQF